MNTNKTIGVAAVALLALGLMSCEGRRADGTPKGETVDVVLKPTVTPTDTADSTVNELQAEPTAETPGGTLPQGEEPATDTQHKDATPGVKTVK